MKSRILLACAILVLIAACSSAVKMAGEDYNPNMRQKMRAYDTYLWMPRLEGDIESVDYEALEKRVQTAAEREFTRKKFYMAKDNEPDFYVAYHVGIGDELSRQDQSLYYDYDFSEQLKTLHTEESPITKHEKGTLIIDIIDAPTMKLAWRGWAHVEVSKEMRDGQKDRVVREAVNELLQDFPPGGKRR